MERKIIQITQSFNTKQTVLTALADDGTLWRGITKDATQTISPENWKWVQIPNVPADTRNFQKQK